MRKVVFVFALVTSVLVSSPGFTQTSNCWDFTEVDPLHVYDTNASHTLTNGFVGGRNPAGSHATPYPFTELTGTMLRMDGGNGDDLRVEIPISGVTPSWILTLHYRTAAGCSSRELMLIEEFGGGSFQAFTILGTAYLNGVPAPFTSLADTWYTMEVRNDNDLNTAELRIWQDGDSRPVAPLVTTTGTGALADLRFRAGNFCAPEKQVDSLCIESLVLIPVESTHWGTIKALYSN